MKQQLSQQFELLHLDLFPCTTTIRIINPEHSCHVETVALKTEDPMVKTTGLSMLSFHYMQYLHLFNALPREEITRRSALRIRDIMPKLLGITRKANDNIFHYNMLRFLRGVGLTENFDEFADILLEMTVYADKALYIHTVMVREISLSIFDCMRDLRRSRQRELRIGKTA